jgi:hypothetical protein
MFYGRGPVRRSCFANVVEALRSAYEKRKNSLTKFEEAYARAWLQEWCKHMVNGGGMIEYRFMKHSTDKTPVKARKKYLKERKRMLKSLAFDWLTTDEANKQ